MPTTALVWFKRDLRQRDHAPLAEAQSHDRAAAVYVIEPDWLASPEFDSQHLAFALASLEPLRAALAARGLPLLVRTGPALAVLQALQQEIGFTHLLSHEEIGPRWTWDRDRAVAAWCRSRGLRWQEWPQSGVERRGPGRPPGRDGWARRWQQRMDAPIVRTAGGFRGVEGLDIPALPTLADVALPPARDGAGAGDRCAPVAGEDAARAALADFLCGRARGYRRAMSSPLTAERGCSRLSAALAFGTLSIRTVHQATERAAAIATERATERATDLAVTRGTPASPADLLPTDATPAADRLITDLRSFGSRLRWHCHFMQKLEDEPDIEFGNFSRAHDGLREDSFDRARFEAWCDGRTGYPMVDACMRQLRATGWLNFRMRAMLVSFAAYHLWLHWREPGLFLARQFLDFEPGIHWSQMQMQSGTTGINTLRMYSPARQALDQDPAGVYVRRWVPEFGTAAYPPPIVDERSALAQARDRLYPLREQAEARAEADAIQRRHGSRRSGLAATGVGGRRGGSAGGKSVRKGGATGNPKATQTREPAAVSSPPPDDDRQQELF